MSLLDSAFKILGISKPVSGSSEYYKQHRELAHQSGNQFYGDGGTIHGTTHLDIQMDLDNNVCAVWFRCRELPFRVSVRDNCRYYNPEHIEIHGLELKVNREPNPEP